jgi:hypothetical protein
MSIPTRRIRREQRTIEAMVQIYCRDHHGPGKTLCPDCDGLLGYARRRLATCPFQEAKTACNRCQVHCYSTTMRERIKEVMRYAGPRMLLRHPVLALFHLMDERHEATSLPKSLRSPSGPGPSPGGFRSG